MTTASDLNRPNQDEEIENSKLDWFASKVMESWIRADSCGNAFLGRVVRTPVELASISYEIAEAMILQRRDLIKKLSLSRKNSNE